MDATELAVEFEEGGIVPIEESEYLADIARRVQSSWPSGIESEVVYPLGEVPVSTYLRRRAVESPDAIAVSFYGYDMTFGQLDEQSDRFAWHLRAGGVRPGDRVAVMLPNCPQFFVAFYGVLKASAVLVPVNPMFKEIELAYELADSGAVVLVFWDALAAVVEAIRAESKVRSYLSVSIGEYLPAEHVYRVPAGLDAPPAHPSFATPFLDALAGARYVGLPEPDIDALAALNYTGGTTGMPKGCEHSQRHMLYTAASAIQTQHLQDGVSLVYIPIFWIAGEDAGLLIPVVAGTRVVLLARWDPEAVLAAIELYGVTALTGTVDNYVELMDLGNPEGKNLATLRYAMAMSFVKRLNPEIRRRWREFASADCLLREAAYGMTETHTIDTFTLGFQDGDADLLSEPPVFCGLPMPGTRFKIVDFETGELCQVGVEGEICVSSPSVTTGYWGNPEATRAALREGWLHSGDAGLIDQQGFLHYMGRRKEMIKVNGMSVFPGELEVLLSAYPGLESVAVVGIPDPDRGETPVAFVKPAPGASVDASEIEQWCRSRFAGYKVPAVRVVTELPMTTTGKVRKEALRERLISGQADS
ncbi:MAG: AMP-binding protein [Actinomycetota bacterium]|nr:AMP-binding protein [Actinomycetota bacterium]